MDKAWIKRLILLDAVLVAVLGWLGYTVWVEAKEARASKRASSETAPAVDLSVPALPAGQASDAPAVDSAGAR